jgi:hypothetical protein
MRKIGVHLVLGLGFAFAVLLGSPAQASTLHVAAPATEAAPEANAPKSSSWWLRAGEARERQGEYAKAGDAYREALLAWPEKKRKGNDGARVAMLSADAYWQAFDRDPNPAHLDAGLAVLDQWLVLTGPQSRATSLSEVKRKYARMKAVRDPLVAADPALTAGDATKAAGHYGEVLDALATQTERDWSVGARISLNAANALVEGYDAKVHAPEDITPHLKELETARDLLVRWKAERPPDDASEQGPAVERALADVQARLAEAEQTLADEARAEQLRERQREADEAARLEAERKEAERIERERKETAAAKAGGKRTLAIVLLSSGVVALGAGAGLLGEGAAYTGVSKEEAAAAEADAVAAEERGEIVDRPRFDPALQAYREDTERRNLGLIIGGSVLAAGGIATGVAGIVLLVKGRSSGKRSQRARLSPVVSPTQLQLSISGRF